MNRKNIYISLFSVLLTQFVLQDNAFAQIGPDLRPPGLPPDHPIHAYSAAEDDDSSAWFISNDWDLDTSDIVFSAAKKKQLISEAPSTIHVITARDIAVHGYRSLPEILRHIPGVQVQTTQSQFHSVMIRGLVGTENNNSRILWLQNGVPMNDVRDSGIWLDETYPIELIKRIEVVLGPGSALYGSGAFQGVVNIFTKDPNDIGTNGEYKLTIQNNLTFKASAVAAYTNDAKTFGILGHISGNTTQGPGLIGDYVYQNYLMSQAGASMSTGNSPTQYRYNKINNNSDKHWYNINFKLNFHDFKWNIGLTDIYAGADGSEIVPNVVYSLPVSHSELNITDDFVIDSSSALKGNKAAYRFNRREFFTDFFYENTFNNNLSILALLSYRMIQYNHKHYGGYTDNEELDIPVISATDNTITSQSTHFKNKVNYETMQHKLYGLAQIQYNFYEANELIAGVVLEYHHINSPEFSNGSSLLFDDNSDLIGIKSPTVNAQKLSYLTPSVFIQDEQKLWNDRIILTAGARFDAYKATTDLDPAPSWRFAFLAKWTSWMTMRLSYGYAFKEPSLYQLYVDTFDYVGDPSLNPETLHNIELSFLFTPLSNMKIRLDAFGTFMQNLIIMRTSPFQGDSFSGTDNRYIPAQDSNANLLGFELSTDVSINRNWNIYGHYNYLYTKRTFHKDDIDINNDYYKYNNIPDDARHRIKLGASYFDEKITADLALFGVFDTPKTISSFTWREDYHTPPYAIIQPQLTIALPANLGLMLSGSIALSEGMTSAPTWHYYYEKEGVPVDRYTISLMLKYPYRKL